MTDEFRLYREERPWWSFADYRCVLEVTRAIAPRSVLEFGPGSSTLALIEGGAGIVYACEDDPHWASVAQERIADQFPGRVRMVPYLWADPLTIPAVDARRFDMALIDGPRETARRIPVLLYALERCCAVLIACENANPEDAGLRPAVAEVVAAHRLTCEYLETGPLAGSFALIGGFPC